MLNPSSASKESPKLKAVGVKRRRQVQGTSSKVTQLRAKIQQEEPIEEKIMPMPEFYMAAQMNRYPKKTNIKCWWCTLNFDEIPLMMPTKIEEDGKVRAEGCFCSFSCLYAHILETVPQPRRGVIISLTNWVLENIFKDLGFHLSRINPSPPRIILKEYGGTISREEYKKIIAGTVIGAMVLQPPIFADVPQLIRIDAFFLTPVESCYSYLHSSIFKNKLI